VSRVRRFALPVMVGLALLLGAVEAGAKAPEPDPRLALAGLGILDGDGWHPAREFRLYWDVAGGAQARAVAVDYLVRDPSGAVVVPTVRAEEDDPRSVVIRVPPLAGEYTAELWLEGEQREGPHAEPRLRFDPDPPAPSRPLAPGAWVRAGVPIEIALEHPAEPWPASGIRGYAIALGQDEGVEPCAGPERCALEETDLDGGPEDDSISVGPLPKGTSFVRAYAVSGAGVRSPRAETAVLHADGEGPTVALDLVPDGWVDGPVEIAARATDAAAGMEAGGPDGARTEIAVDGNLATVAPGGRASAVVAGEGVHAVLASARDAVGNLSPSAPSPASAAALVRIDETPPRVAFARPDPAQPERLDAIVGDALSGPDPRRGSIAVRPAGGSAPFLPIPTAVEPGRLVAVWDSDSYPRGRYEFEAIAYDLAGNRGLGTRSTGGAPMVLANPVKTTTTLLTGFGGPRALEQSCRRRNGTVRCRRHSAGGYAERAARRLARYGQRIAVGGRLSAPSGVPLAAQEVTVVETFDAGAELVRRESQATTLADGTFLLPLAAGPSRRVQVEFAGTPLLGRSSARPLRLGVRAPVRLRCSTATAAVGGAPVAFSGRIGPAGAAAPPGLSVALEFRVGNGAWSEFRTLRADERGRFRYPYAFADDDSRGVRFQFRAVVPHQPGWPYAAGASLPVTVSGR